jgi:protein TonB
MADYLANYPSGKYSDVAANRIDELNRGEIVAVEVPPADTIVDVPTKKIPEEKPKVTKPVTPKKKTKTPITPKPKPAPDVRPTPKPTVPTKTENPKPAPVDPNAPVALVSAARRPVFKKCSNSNKAKEAKCTEERIYRYLKNGFVYPEEALRKSIEGSVVVSFVVERDGSITDVKALNDIGGGCAKEAVRLIKSLPKFQPGLNAKGDAIRVHYTQPVRFSLR